MSARRPTARLPRPLRKVPTTPVLPPTARWTSMPQEDRRSATRAAVRCSSSPSSGWAWRSRRHSASWPCQRRICSVGVTDCSCYPQYRPDGTGGQTHRRRSMRFQPAARCRGDIRDGHGRGRGRAAMAGAGAAGLRPGPAGPVVAEARYEAGAGRDRAARGPRARVGHRRAVLHHPGARPSARRAGAVDAAGAGGARPAAAEPARTRPRPHGPARAGAGRDGLRPNLVRRPGRQRADRAGALRGSRRPRPGARRGGARPVRRRGPWRGAGALRRHPADRRAGSALGHTRRRRSTSW